MQDTLRFGPLGDGAAHLCIDMQRLFGAGSAILRSSVWLNSSCGKGGGSSRRSPSICTGDQPAYDLVIVAGGQQLAVRKVAQMRLRGQKDRRRKFRRQMVAQVEIHIEAAQVGCSCAAIRSIRRAGYTCPPVACPPVACLTCRAAQIGARAQWTGTAVFSKGGQKWRRAGVFRVHPQSPAARSSRSQLQKNCVPCAALARRMN